jgi:hypothetical protein
VLALSGPVEVEPLSALLPLHPPEAVQLVAPLVDQVSDDEPPVETDAGLAEMEMEGATLGCTVTTAVPEAVPPAPLQLSENEEVVVNAPVDCVPLVGLGPAQPPEAVHSVAPVADHVSVDASPSIIGLGLAVMVTVGAAVLTLTDALAVALPPAPEQVSVNVLVPVPSVPVTSVPEVGLLPDQAPDAVHEEARADCQLRPDVPGAERLAGLADRLTVGGSFVPGPVSVPPSPPLQPASMNSATQDRARHSESRPRGMERASLRREIIGI